MVKKLLRLSPMQMLGSSLILFAFDILLVTMFVFQPKVLGGHPSDWDFRIDEARSVENSTDVAGVSISREDSDTSFPTVTPTPTPTPTSTPSPTPTPTDVGTSQSRSDEQWSELWKYWGGGNGDDEREYRQPDRSLNWDFDW